MKHTLFTMAPLLLAAACTTDPQGASAPNTAALGQKVVVDGPAVTPTKVLEDSRCPQGLECVWSGQVRIMATIHLGSGDTERELTLGQPVPVADGALALVSVAPERKEGKDIAPANYRFTFRFDGGL